MKSASVAIGAVRKLSKPYAGFRMDILHLGAKKLDRRRIWGYSSFALSFLLAPAVRLNCRVDGAHDGGEY